MSDSPPEKDVQWSSQGANAAYKFLQKIYNLNNSIINRPDHKPLNDKDFSIKINAYILKVTSLINNFQLNVVVANVYEIYSLFNSNLESDISNKCLTKNMKNLMTILIPFIPHLANECLEQMGEKDVKKWPQIDETTIVNQKIQIAIQINGKTREVIEVKKDMNEKNVINEIKKNEKINKNLKDKKIIKIIFVKNRIINYLVQ